MKVKMTVLISVVILGMLATMPVVAQITTRTLPQEYVEPGADFTVTITADDYGSFGEVDETLCDGWVYQSVTGDVRYDEVRTHGNVISFLLMGGGPKTFTYTVQAPNDPGACCNISGTLTDIDIHNHTVTGDSEVCVHDNGDLISANRGISNQRVEPGSTFTVMLALTANVDGVQKPALDENLPAGWIVTEVNNNDAIYDPVTTNWTWTVKMFSGVTISVVYDVTVPTDAVSQDYYISGHASAYGVDPLEIGGESRVTVVTLCGDVNHDELLLTTDVLLALQMAANNTDIDFAADVNADGVVTAVDALSIWQSMLS